MSTTEKTAAAAPKGSSHGARRLGLGVLFAVVVIGGVAYGAWWALVGRNFQDTDDAYVSGDVVQITSQVPGTVIALHVDDTQNVRRGQPLLELDPVDAQVTAAAAEANLARAVRAVRTLFAQGAQLRAQIAERQTELKRALDDYRRRAGLTADGAVSAEELAHTQDAIAQLRASLAAAQEQLNATNAQIDGTTVRTHPQVLAAEAAVRDAALALHRTHIVAPVDGVAARRSVQVGQRVAPGTPLLAVVPLEDVWVDANFKEVQLARMRVGQPVTLHADIYGGRQTYNGRLAGLSAGSGNAFALLPPQNATGNWIKIVQRVPVRIALDLREVQAHPLRIGLSMTASVDISNETGPLVADQVRSVPLPVEASDGDDPAVAALIERIVAANAGGGPAAHD
ncbi:MAG: HlyD family efflux transporter periplasmic adaptor subunit [Nevskia sp.]|nr:HlyD family efflux transporter periplasmic adaptor subunit [Nevskia sp.]